jgi:hypothetical protein
MQLALSQLDDAYRWLCQLRSLVVNYFYTTPDLCSKYVNYFYTIILLLFSSVAKYLYFIGI